MCHSEQHNKIPAPSLPGVHHPLSSLSGLHMLPSRGHLAFLVSSRNANVSIAVLVSRSPLRYFIMALRCKTSDAGNSDMPERSRKVLPLHENVQVPYYLGFPASSDSGSWNIFPMDKRGQHGN